MELFLDGDSTVQREACPDCGAEYVLVKSFVLDEIGPHAVAFSALHHHGGAEAWMDVVFGDFVGDEGAGGRFTFGCRVSAVIGSTEPAATAVDAATPYADSPTFGHKLSRDEALTHPEVSVFWDVVDFLLMEEPTINHHVYGHSQATPKGKARRWWSR